MSDILTEDLAEGIRTRDPKAIEPLLESEEFHQLYTACQKLCLGFLDDTESLFYKTVMRAMRNASTLGTSVEHWLFAHFHKEWRLFAQENPNLHARSSSIVFDWSRLDVNQNKDVLTVLSPLEREIYVYRFLLKYSLAQIHEFTGMQEEKILNVFHEAMKKVITA